MDNVCANVHLETVAMHIKPNGLLLHDNSVSRRTKRIGRGMNRASSCGRRVGQQVE